MRRAFSRSRRRMQVGFLAVHRDVEPGSLVGDRGAKRDKEANQLEQDEAHRAAVDDGREDRGAWMSTCRGLP